MSEGNEEVRTKPIFTYEGTDRWVTTHELTEYTTIQPSEEFTQLADSYGVETNAVGEANRNQD